MDISLFERMVNNGINSVKLNIQHRMRPEIANLIRPTIYKELADHELVTKYPNVMGINKNVFFITHNELETNVIFEKEMLYKAITLPIDAFCGLLCAYECQIQNEQSEVVALIRKRELIFQLFRFLFISKRLGGRRNIKEKYFRSTISGCVV